MKSAQYLDQVKKKLNVHTDKELAEYFELTKAAISQYRSGARIMDHEMCLAVGLALGMDRQQAMEIVIAADIDRAERAGQKSLWSVFSERMAATAATVAIASAVTLFLTPQNAEARSYSPTSTAQADTVYIMSNQVPS